MCVAETRKFGCFHNVFTRFIKFSAVVESDVTRVRNSNLPTRAERSLSLED